MDLEHRDLEFKDLEFKDQAFKEMDQGLSHLWLKNKEMKRLMEDKLFNIEPMGPLGEIMIFYKVRKARQITSLLVVSNQQTTNLILLEVLIAQLKIVS